jgi:hypothetical protein
VPMEHKPQNQAAPTIQLHNYPQNLSCHIT